MVEIINKVLSPIQTWQDFNPNSDDLEISILNCYVQNDITYTELIFTAQEKEDGKIRVYCMIARKKELRENSPVILVIPGVNGMPEDEILNSVVEDGFVYVTFDYAGRGEKRTEYPGSVSYGYFDSIENIIEVKGSPKNTPWYLWAMICRRVITVVAQQYNEPPICLAGVNLGANIGWMVAGMDGRVSCFVSINGSGYIETMKSYYKPVIADEYPTSWTAGLAPQSYVKYINCPVLYVGGTNNVYSNLDKAQDLLANVSSEDKYQTLCPNAEGSITADAFDSIKAWLYRFFVGDKTSILDTQVSFKNSDGKLYALVKVLEKNVDKIRIFIAEKETLPNIREWQKITQFTTLNNGECILPLNIESVNDKIYCFANTYYNDGMILASKVIGIVPAEIGILKENLPQKIPSRIVYNSSMGNYYFFGKNNSFIFDRKLITKKAGAFGISGIGLEGGGSLYTFNVGDQKFRDNVNAGLQMDAYTVKDVTIEIIVYSQEEELIPYSVRVYLKGCEQWQQINLNPNDFKNYEMISLDSYSSIKKIEFKNIDDVLFNNILWV